MLHCARQRCDILVRGVARDRNELSSVGTHSPGPPCVIVVLARVRDDEPVRERRAGLDACLCPSLHMFVHFSFFLSSHSRLTYLFTCRDVFCGMFHRMFFFS